MQFEEYAIQFFENFYTYNCKPFNTVHVLSISNISENTLFDELSFSRRLSWRLTFERPHGAEQDRGSRNGRRLTIRKMNQTFLGRKNNTFVIGSRTNTNSWLDEILC